MLASPKSLNPCSGQPRQEASSAGNRLKVRATRTSGSTILNFSETAADNLVYDSYFKNATGTGYIADTSTGDQTVVSSFPLSVNTLDDRYEPAAP